MFQTSQDQNDVYIGRISETKCFTFYPHCLLYEGITTHNIFNKIREVGNTPNDLFICQGLLTEIIPPMTYFISKPYDT